MFARPVLQDVPYAKYTHLDYFVFTTTPSVSHACPESHTHACLRLEVVRTLAHARPQASAISQAGIDDSLIRDFVSRAHKAGVTVSYTVGGWTGSQCVGSLCANER